MKKFVTLMAVSCGLAVSAEAQLLGIEGGVTFNTLRTEIEDVDVDNSMRTGFKAGMFIDAPIGRGASFQPGLYYVTKGSEQEISSRIGNTILEEEQNISLSYLEIPLNFQFKLNPMRRSGLFFGAGPYVAFAIDGEVDYEATSRDASTGAILGAIEDDAELEIGNEEGEDDIRKTDWGINLNLGYVGTGGLFIRGNAGIGLSNIVPGQDDDLSSKNMSWALTLGYVFGR